MNGGNEWDAKLLLLLLLPLYLISDRCLSKRVCLSVQFSSFFVRSFVPSLLRLGDFPRCTGLRHHHHHHVFSVPFEQVHSEW